jgi:hypothetical protein
MFSAELAASLAPAGAATLSGVSASGAAIVLSSAPSPSVPAPEDSSETPKCRRILMATSSSIELECVFFSVTPNSGRIAMIALFGCSHSRASSLIRIFFISTFSSLAPLRTQNKGTSFPDTRAPKLA